MSWTSSLRLATLLTFAAGLSHAATFHVEQYDGYLGTDLATYQAHAAANTPDFEAYVDGIDFTDDPAGFAGAIPGSSPWPGEIATGQTGTNSAVNTTFFARITASFSTTVADTYTFRTFNDDGVFLFINGDLVINDPTLHGEREFTGMKLLQAGTHTMELIFFENGGEASLEFSFRDSLNPYSLTGGPNVTLNQVPLPGSGFVLLSGLAGVALARRRG